MCDLHTSMVFESNVIAEPHTYRTCVFIELFFGKKIPLSRRVEYVMDGSTGQ